MLQFDLAEALLDAADLGGEDLRLGLKMGAELVEALVDPRIVVSGGGRGRHGPACRLGAFEPVDALFEAGHLAADENFADPLDLAGWIEG